MDTYFVYKCFWHSCLLEGFDIMMIIMIIMMIMIILVMSIILYTFLLSSCSPHVTCFQEWHCDKCERIFNFERNYKYHVKSCSGVNKYKCEICGNEYLNKKSLWQHRMKQHGNDVCCLTFLWRICTILISHIHYEDMQWTFFIIYILMYCIIDSRKWE